MLQATRPAVPARETTSLMCGSLSSQRLDNCLRHTICALTQGDEGKAFEHQQAHAALRQSRLCTSACSVQYERLQKHITARDPLKMLCLPCRPQGQPRSKHENDGRCHAQSACSLSRACFAHAADLWGKGKVEKTETRSPRQLRAQLLHP